MLGKHALSLDEPEVRPLRPKGIENIPGGRGHSRLLIGMDNNYTSNWRRRWRLCRLRRWRYQS
jgi:hypothetical protein